MWLIHLFTIKNIIFTLRYIVPTFYAFTYQFFLLFAAIDFLYLILIRLHICAVSNEIHY